MSKGEQLEFLPDHIPLPVSFNEILARILAFCNETYLVNSAFLKIAEKIPFIPSSASVLKKYLNYVQDQLTLKNT